MYICYLVDTTCILANRLFFFLSLDSFGYVTVNIKLIFLLCKAQRLQKWILFVLLSEGYLEAAELFRFEANVEPTDDMSTLEERMKVREAVQSGDIENAVQLINSFFPGLLLANDELRFQLQVLIFWSLLYSTKEVMFSSESVCLFACLLAGLCKTCSPDWQRYALCSISLCFC